MGTKTLTRTVDVGGSLVLAPLAESARGYVASGKAQSTRRAYRSHWRAFDAWCASQGLEALPARPETVALYAATLADDGRKVSTIEQALADSTDSLMSLPGVVGTAQGLCDDEPCIKVFVVKKTPELLRQIPAEIEGYTVAVEETGEIKALEP